jgi:glucosylceramidase
MRRYIASGASAYMYWNIALAPGGASHWGWHQNSLLSVDPQNAEPAWNPDYSVLKHVSHFVRPGSRVLATSGADQTLLAFRTPERRTVAVIRNDKPVPASTVLQVGTRRYRAQLPADSFNSLLL